MVATSAPSSAACDDVDRVAHRGDQHLGVEVVVVVDRRTIWAISCHAVLADVVEPADERRDVGRRPALAASSACAGREAERDVGGDVLVAKRAHRAQAGRRERHLDHHVVGDLGEDAPFLHDRRRSRWRAPRRETGPGTSRAISAPSSRYVRPSLAISDGLVVDAVDHAPFEAGLDLVDLRRVSRKSCMLPQRRPGAVQ